MASKPTVSLWSLAERKYQKILAESLLRFADAQPGQPLTIHVNAETRTYQLTSQLDSLQRPTGAIMTCSATKPVSSLLASLLLMSGCLVSELVVVLLGCEAIKSERALDLLEGNLRQTLSAQGFDGDAATIVRVPARVPTFTHVAAIVQALEEKQLLQAPLEEPRTPPARHPNTMLASALLALKSMLSLSSRLTLVKSTAEDLLDGHITTQFGGMPYLELEDRWPVCDTDNEAMTFLCQLDAREHLHPTIEGAGLYVCYLCTNRRHYHVPHAITVLHYPDPNPEIRQKQAPEALAMIEGTLTPGAYGASVEYQNELPPLLAVQHEQRFQRFRAALQTLASPKKQLALYQELSEILGATLASTHDPSGELRRCSLGGYSEGFTPSCDTCYQPMRSLANLGYRLDAREVRWPPFDVQLFVCECDLYEVKSMTSGELDDW